MIGCHSDITAATSEFVFVHCLLSDWVVVDKLLDKRFTMHVFSQKIEWS